jgi:pilus assembly protein CpaB
MFLLKPRYVIPLAIISGLLTTYAVNDYLKRHEEPNREPEIVMQSVVVASHDLQAGTALAETDMIVRQWPAEIVPEGTFADREGLENRVVRIDVTSGEAILASKLAPLGSSGGISGLIPEGMRALTVAVNVVSGVGGFILPGTRVDVLVTVAPSSKKTENTTKTILQNVEVLAVDQTYKNDSDEPITVKSVTLLVTPDGAEKLALAANEGKLQLSLRSSVDGELASTGGVKMDQLIYQPKPKPVYHPKPKTTQVVEPAPQPKVVEIIRANVRSEVEFDEDESDGSESKNSEPVAKE